MIEDLQALVRMPTVSDTPAVRQAGAWLSRRLAFLGARLIPMSGPVVVAELKGDPAAPTVLIYGHYDVVPAGPLDRWSVPPFGAVRTGRTLWGRGTSDDKGPVVAGLHAVEKLGATRVNLKFIYDGEEEIGSPTLSRSLGRMRAWLSDVDAVVVCDTNATPTGRPTLTRSLRGGISLDLVATGTGRALHTGRYGGAAPDPAHAVARVVSALDEPEGTSIVVTSLATNPADARVIPATATAKLDVRMVSPQVPDRIANELADHVKTACPPGIRLSIRSQIRSEPWQLRDFGHPMLRVACAAVKANWGVEPAFVRSGGSIPVVPLLATVAPKAALLLLGFTLPSDGAHSVDEHVDLPRMFCAAETLADLINRVGGERP
ncbi:M20/M25/M40 family metallo-hydrolase [Kibdelosporangium philippinense]|uniref:M20/M25/M40 family metallo-hydrolase n=1 Tax=Kibdelosporangium philippinense TaxID=211113 RepID=A0ABS8ZSY0_9PSEU|nr:M20/M25/M40 family metallo-hydrolase [Kibdelosporangium philippinense]MCE7010834.1 M20/M25/M40 family metallo-hydrolase [Kibdelosporangium philippinense]